MNVPVFDLHCDTALAMLSEETCRPVGRLAKRTGHVDLERGKTFRKYCQLFALFTTPDMGPHSPETYFNAMLSNLLKELEENRGQIAQARTMEDVKTITADGKIAAVLSLEGPAGISFDPGRLEELADLGFRMTTLTWNEENPLAGSHKTGGGLTAQGKEYIRRAEHYGMALDVSHLSDKAFWQMLDLAQGPVSASHSNSRKVCPVSRNLTDEMFKAICETGGVAGINLCPAFLGEGTVDVETICRHILHFLELGGEKHIALGGDFDGVDSLPQGITGIDCWPKVAQALLGHGVDESTIEDLFWNNAIRMFGLCSM